MTGPDVKQVAKDLERVIQKGRNSLSLPNSDLEIGINHLAYMCRCIYNEQVTGTKAWLWLGYVQGALRTSGGPTVQELIEMMRDVKEGSG